MADQILMPQVVQPLPGGQPLTANQTLGREMHRGTMIGLGGAVVAAYGFVEDSKPAKWIGIAAALYGAWSWWKAYQQNNAVVAGQQAAMLSQAQTQSQIMRGAGPSGMINGMGDNREQPSSTLPDRPLRSVP